MGRVAFATRRRSDRSDRGAGLHASMGRVAFATRRRRSARCWRTRSGRFNGARCVRNAKEPALDEDGGTQHASMGRVAFATRRPAASAARSPPSRSFNGARCVRNAKDPDVPDRLAGEHCFNGARCVRNAKGDGGSDPDRERAASMGRVAFATRRTMDAMRRWQRLAASMGRVAFATRRIGAVSVRLRGECFNGARCVRNAKDHAGSSGRVHHALQWGALRSQREGGRMVRRLSVLPRSLLQWGALRSQREGRRSAMERTRTIRFNGARCVRNAKANSP